jgi:hypothetical protein
VLLHVAPQGYKTLEPKTLRGRCPLKLPQQGNDSPAPRNLKNGEHRGSKKPTNSLNSILSFRFD